MKEKEINLVKKAVRKVNNFPKEGIIFRDVMPIIKNPKIFNIAISQMVNLISKNSGQGFNYLACTEARGFLFGTGIAMKMKKGIIPVRKKGKLPPPVKEFSYTFEYNNDTVAISPLSFKKGDKIILFDDVLATGNTAYASIKLIEKLGGKIEGVYFLMDLYELPEGKELLKDYNPKILFTV